MTDTELQAHTNQNGVTVKPSARTSKKQSLLIKFTPQSIEKKIQGCNVYLSTCNYNLPGAEAAAPESQRSQVDQTLM